MKQLRENEKHDTTSDYAYRRANETILRPRPPKTGEFFADIVVRKNWNEIIAAAPGSEKSKVATQIANDLWDKYQEPTLYLMLTHAAIDDRFKWIREDKKEGNWLHYKGHKDGCRVIGWANIGYSGVKCSCDRELESIEPNKPTLAALNVILMNELSERPTHPDLELFPLWIIDEIDFNKFMGKQHCKRRSNNVPQGR